MAIPKTMRAIHIPHPNNYAFNTNPCRGASLVLSKSFPTPTPTPTQALIRIHATGISPFELQWEGAYTLTNPRIPCFDIAGTIVSAPPSSGYTSGDRVFGLFDYYGQGGLAEYAVAEPGLLARIPKELDFVQASSLPRAALTVWQAVYVKGKVEKGIRVLITGATGAVGKFGVQILKMIVGEKGTVIAVGGNRSEELKGLGADVVVDYRENRDWEATVGEVDWAFDCVGGETLLKCLGIVKSGGQLVTVGTPIPVWENVKGWKEAKEKGVDALFFIVEENAEQLTKIAELARSGAIKPSVSLVVDGLTEEGVRDGWTRAERGGLSGTVVVKQE